MAQVEKRDKRRIRRQITEGRIKKAVIKTVAEEGVKGATTKKIAKVAGVSEALLFKYYRDKEELLMKIFVETMNELYEYLDTRIDKEAHPKAQLMQFIDNIVDYALINPHTIQFVFIMRSYYNMEIMKDVKRPFMILEHIINDLSDMKTRVEKPYVVPFIVSLITRSLDFYLRGELPSDVDRYKKNLKLAVETCVGV